MKIARRTVEFHSDSRFEVPPHARAELESTFLAGEQPGALIFYDDADREILRVEGELVIRDETIVRPGDS